MHDALFVELESYRDEQLKVLRRNSARSFEQAMSEILPDQLIYFAFDHSLQSGKHGRRLATFKLGQDIVDVKKLGDCISRGSLPYAPLLFLNLGKHEGQDNLNFMRQYHPYLEEFFAGGLSGVIAPETLLDVRKTEKFVVEFLRTLFEGGNPPPGTQFTVSDVLWMTKRSFCQAGNTWALLYSYFLVDQVSLPYQLEHRKPIKAVVVAHDVPQFGGLR